MSAASVVSTGGAGACRTVATPAAIRCQNVLGLLSRSLSESQTTRSRSGCAASHERTATVLPPPGGAEIRVRRPLDPRIEQRLDARPVDDLAADPRPEQPSRHVRGRGLFVPAALNERGGGPRHPERTVSPGKGYPQGSPPVCAPFGTHRTPAGVRREAKAACRPRWTPGLARPPTCLTSTSSRPSPWIRSSTPCSAAWSLIAPLRIVSAGSTSASNPSKRESRLFPILPLTRIS